MRSRFAMGVVAFLGMSGAGLAQGPGGLDFLDLFGMLDANNDMVIERDEVPEKGRAAFDRVLKVADADRDGRLGLDEYREALRSARESAPGAGPNRPGIGGGALLARMDADGDGKVGRDEFRGPAPLFDRLDADRDGFITRDEALAFRGPLPEPPLTPGAMAERFRAMDADGDGKVGRDEFRGPAPLFDRLDRNGDGVIDAAEVRDFRPAGLPALKKAQRPRDESKAAGKTPKKSDDAASGPPR